MAYRDQNRNDPQQTDGTGSIMDWRRKKAQLEIRKLLMRKVLLIMFMLPFFGFAQQNEEFRAVKNYYNKHRGQIADQFMKMNMSKKKEYSFQQIDYGFKYFMAKMDSVENAAFVEALVKVKNREDLENFSSAKLINASTAEKKSKKRLEVKPQYPGGINQLMQEIADNLYMDSILQNGETEKTEVFFTVKKDGTITHVRATGNNPSANRQAEIAVYKLSKKFEPAQHGGQLVPYHYEIPLTLKY